MLKGLYVYLYLILALPLSSVTSSKTILSLNLSLIIHKKEGKPLSQGYYEEQMRCKSIKHRLGYPKDTQKCVRLPHHLTSLQTCFRLGRWIWLRWTNSNVASGVDWSPNGKAPNVKRLVSLLWGPLHTHTTMPPLLGDGWHGPADLCMRSLEQI